MTQLSARDKVREGLSAALDKKAAAVLVFNLTDLTTLVVGPSSAPADHSCVADSIAVSPTSG